MANPRLRVLYLIDFLSDVGGAERFVLALLEHLPRDRIAPWACVTRGVEERPLQALRDAGVPCTNLRRRGSWDLPRTASLVSLLRRERFDVLHAHMFGSNLWGSVIGRACHVPVVLAHEHTWSYEGNALRAWLDGRVIGRLATRFVAVSALDAERMVSIERVPANKVLVMPTAYVPSVQTVRSDIRSECGLPPDAKLIATAAVLRPQKALTVLLEAFARLRSGMPEAHLAIAGDGECRAVLQERARQLGLGDSVHFLGRRQDIDSILRDADVGAMSSDFEGMPLFAFECMAAGRPLVTTAVGALPDVVEDGVTGRLVPPRDPQALAAAMADLLANPTRARRLGAAAHERVVQFRIEAVAERFAECYERLLSEARH